MLIKMLNRKPLDGRAIKYLEFTGFLQYSEVILNAYYAPLNLKYPGTKK